MHAPARPGHLRAAFATFLPLAVLATLLYRLFQYWMPLPAGLGASILFRRRHRDDALHRSPGPEVAE